MKLNAIGNMLTLTVKYGAFWSLTVILTQQLETVVAGKATVVAKTSADLHIYQSIETNFQR